jgi:hypothetical protein
MDAWDLELCPWNISVLFVVGYMAYLFIIPGEKISVEMNLSIIIKMAICKKFK